MNEALEHTAGVRRPDAFERSDGAQRTEDRGWADRYLGYTGSFLCGRGCGGELIPKEGHG
jgi:hypothetical protein